MSGFMSPVNPVVGGTVLRRAAIQSPNYVTGVSGWAIKQDGSAEFNNVVIRGSTVEDSVALYYSGTPAAGELIASVAAAAGTDAFGNAYLAGIVAYDPSSSPVFAARVGNGQVNFLYATTEAGPWTDPAVGVAIDQANSADFLTLLGGSLNLMSFSGSPMAVLEGIKSVNPATLNTQETIHNLATGIGGVTGSVGYAWTGLVFPQKYVQLNLTLAAGTTITSGTTLVTLPANYAAASNGREFFAAYSAHGVTGDTPVAIAIDTAGNVTMAGASFTAPAGGNSFLSGQTVYA
jgi:hypothetical protein